MKKKHPNINLTRPFLPETSKFMWVTNLQQLPACPVGFQWLVAPVQCAGFPGTNASLTSNEFGRKFGAGTVAGASAACGTCASAGITADAGADLYPQRSSAATRISMFYLE